MKTPEEQLTAIGFEHEETYTHDRFTSHRYKKGYLEVEVTYYNRPKPHLIDVTIDEAIGVPITLQQIQQLDEILNNK